MVPEAVTEWEKKKAEMRVKREVFQQGKRERGMMMMRGGKEKGQKVAEEEDRGDEREALLRDLMTPCADQGKGGDADGLECPDVGDLIGFVTSGGYNLKRGGGSGIGAVWVQRVLEGWFGGADHDGKGGGADGDIGREVGGMKIKQGGGDRTRLESKQRERERRLCIVRNAGEKVGRLAIWEVCE